MSEYRRKIIGVVKRMDERLQLTHASSTKFSEKVRYKSEFTIRYGFRLECGHSVDARRGAGKKHVDCYECEWLASPDYKEPPEHSFLEFDLIFINGDWEDASEDEARRIQAQS